MRTWIGALAVVGAVWAQEADAQQQWETVCQPGLQGRVECTHTASPQGISFPPSQAISPEAAQSVLAPSPDAWDYATAGLRGMAASDAKFAAQQAQQEARVSEARRAILADPDNAELIAKMYGVEISPETQQVINQIRAKKRTGLP